MDGPDSPPDSRFADSRFATVTPTHPPTTTATRGPRARADPAARGLIGAPRVHVAAGGRRHRVLSPLRCVGRTRVATSERDVETACDVCARASRGAPGSRREAKASTHRHRCAVRYVGSWCEGSAGGGSRGAVSCRVVARWWDGGVRTYHAIHAVRARAVSLGGWWWRRLPFGGCGRGKRRAPPCSWSFIRRVGD